MCCFRVNDAITLAPMVKAKWNSSETYFYLPIDPERFFDNNNLLYLHWGLVIFYYPISSIDRVITGMIPVKSLPSRSISRTKGPTRR